MLDTFLKSNETKWRLARTIFQGVFGVLAANLDLLLGYTIIPPELRPVIAGCVMAIMSPIMSEMRGDTA